MGSDLVKSAYVELKSMGLQLGELHVREVLPLNAVKPLFGMRDAPVFPLEQARVGVRLASGEVAILSVPLDRDIPLDWLGSWLYRAEETLGIPHRVPSRLDPQECTQVLREYFLPSVFSSVDGTGRVLLVLGPSASGKSVARKVLSRAGGWANMHHLDTSMDSRTAGGMGGVFKYGEQATKSTGQVSVSATLRILETAREATKPTLVFLDEPDLGTSDEVALGLGRYVSEILRELPESLRCVVITSHSREFVSAFRDASVVFLGQAYDSVGSWVDRKLCHEHPEVFLARSKVGLAGLR